MITYITGKINDYIHSKLERIEKIGPNPFLWCYTDTLVLTTFMFFNQIGGPPDPDFHTYQRSFKWFIYFGKVLAMIMSLIISFTVSTLVYPLDLIDYLYHRKIFITNVKGPDDLKGLFDDYYFKPKKLVIRGGEIKSLCDSNGDTVLPKGLKQLYINDTKIIKLKGIPEGVEYLNLNNNEITDLSALPRSVKTFYLGRNPCID